VKAVVLAAGEGTRLRPLTVSRPKVMLRVGDKPILQYAIDALREVGVRDIIIVVGYQKERIQTFFEDGERFGVNISYVVQRKQLGTGHALLSAREHLDGDFLVVPGDNILDGAMIAQLLDHRSEVTVLATESAQPRKYGVLELDGDRVVRIIEKPPRRISNLISTGIYYFEHRFLELLEREVGAGRFELSLAVQTAIDEGFKVRGELTKGLWLDVVFPWDLLSLNARVLSDAPSRQAGTVEAGVTLSGPVSIGEGSVLRSGTYIKGPVSIGKGCEIGPNVVIYPTTSIGDNVTISPFTEVRNSLIMDNVSIGGHSYISHSIIDEGSTIQSHFVTAAEPKLLLIENELIQIDKIGSIVGESCEIGHRVVVDAGRTIGAYCRIEAGNRIIKDIPDSARVV
jgi:UDP-N-acetylglucosamine diphosphorylase/glucosamine-1-phosphate N-acetyltransferase